VQAEHGKAQPLEREARLVGLENQLGLGQTLLFLEQPSSFHFEP
jgi:hypothetical protein